MFGLRPASGWLNQLVHSAAHPRALTQVACSPESSSLGNQRHCYLSTGRRQAIHRSVSSPSPDTVSAISHITWSRPYLPSSMLEPSRRWYSSPRRRSPSSPVKIRRLPLPPVTTAPLSSSSQRSRNELSSTGSRRPNPLFHRLREAAGLADGGGQGGGVVEEKEQEGEEEEELGAGPARPSEARGRSSTHRCR
jgi:hypothetical protein